jgi:hypothetical protein
MKMAKLTLECIGIYPQEAPATIPMPTATYVLATVRAGHRRWTVRDYGDAATVTNVYDPKQRPMRRCGLRTRILDVVRACA